MGGILKKPNPPLVNKAYQKLIRRISTSNQYHINIMAQKNIQNPQRLMAPLRPGKSTIQIMDEILRKIEVASLAEISSINAPLPVVSSPFKYTQKNQADTLRNTEEFQLSDAGRSSSIQGSSNSPKSRQKN